MPLAEWVVESMADLAAQTVSMSHEVAMEAYALPGTFHKDPADRILVAVARRNGLTLVTADDRILSYPHVRTQDARR
jgi:PIN domain nuclease of toxin-antitoxin system